MLTTLAIIGFWIAADQPGISVVLPGVGSMGKTATFVVERQLRVEEDDVFGSGSFAGRARGGDLDGKGTTVTVGGRSAFVPLGQKRAFQISADNRMAQLVEIGNEKYFVEVRPGSVLRLQNRLHYGWVLYSRAIDLTLAKNLFSRCVETGSSCPYGYAKPEGAMAIGTCEKRGLERCVELGRIRLDSRLRTEVSIEQTGAEAKRIEVIPRSPTAYLPVYYSDNNDCVLQLGGNRYRLLIGPGQNWTIHISGSGEVEKVTVDPPRSHDPRPRVNPKSRSEKP